MTRHTTGPPTPGRTRLSRTEPSSAEPDTPVPSRGPRARLTRTASASVENPMTMQLTDSICLKAALLVIGMAVIGGVPVASAQSENVCARTVQVGTAGQASSGTLSFIDTAGEPWDLPTTLP